MRFRGLGDGFVFFGIGFGVLAAAAATLGSVPELPPPAATVQVAAVPFLVDISSFSAPAVDPLPLPLPEAEPEADSVPEPEPEPPAKVLGSTSPARVARAPVAKPAAAVRTPSPTPSSKRRPKTCTVAPDPLIQSTGSDAWTVRQAVVQRYTRDWSKLDDLGWSAPHKGADGRGDGMQIGGIRCGSDVYDAGFRTGDVIHSVNGKAVKNIAQALLVYAAIHNDEVFRVAITRRGVSRTLTYRLR